MKKENPKLDSSEEILTTGKDQDLDLPLLLPESKSRSSGSIHPVLHHFAHQY